MKENLLTDSSMYLSRATSDVSPIYSRSNTDRAKFSESRLKSARLHNMAQRAKAKKALELLS